MTDLRFPVGRFDLKAEITADDRPRLIDQIAEAPARLREAVKGLSPSQIDTPYRDGGWTVRQVVHHLPDSHLNSYTRFKLALTEDEPTIKPYDEDQWAKLYDAQSAPLEVSLALLESLHARWVILLRTLTEKDFARAFIHPELGAVSLTKSLGLYAWHGRHHVAHITSLRERMGWI